MTPKTDDLVKLLPCPFCGGEAEFMLDGTQPDVTCKECDISYSVQVSDHFTQEERYNNPDFQWRDGPEYNYGPGGQKRAKDLLTEYWNTRTQPPQDGWKDISTAPRDGQAFLVYTPDNMCTYQVYRRMWEGDKFLCWRRADDLQVSQAVRFTHWQPLPLPPQPAKTDGDKL